MRTAPLPTTPTKGAPPPVIRVEGVSAAIGGRTVVSGVDLTIAPGERVAVVGTNGAGKSTLLRALAGLARPPAGRVTLDGRDLHTMSARERARVLAVVGQEETPPAELRVAEMVALARLARRPPWAMGGADERRAVASALEQVGLLDRADDLCDRLSGGERRRAMIARGLAQECPVLVLDEPTNHLDIAWQLRVLDLIGHQEATVLAAVHDLDLVLRHFTTAVVLADGGVLAVGPPEEVFVPEVLTPAFAVATTQVAHPDHARPHLLITAPQETS